MENTYHDLVIRKEIEHAVEHSNRFNSGYGTFYGMTVDEAVEFWKAQAKEDPDIPFHIATIWEQEDLLSGQKENEFLTCIMQHPEKHRLRRINDGSYYSHRIWIHTDGDVVFVSPSIDWATDELRAMSDEMYKLPFKEQINYLFAHFEVVYIQYPICESREDVERFLSQEKFYRLSDFGDY